MYDRRIGQWLTHDSLNKNGHILSLQEQRNIESGLYTQSRIGLLIKLKRMLQGGCPDSSEFPRFLRHL